MKRDKLIFDLIEDERERQTNGIELIASENYVSDQVLEAMGSILTNKYAEGYPGARYYGGCGIRWIPRTLRGRGRASGFGLGGKYPPVHAFLGESLNKNKKKNKNDKPNKTP